MADDSLNHSQPTINLPLQVFDSLIESIAKADALLQVTMITDAEALLSDSQTYYHFLWALHDIVYEMGKLCESCQP